MDTAKRKRESEPDTEYTEQPQSTTRKIHKPNPTTLLEDEAIRLAPYRRESKSTSPSSDELDSPDETSSSDGCDEKEEPNSEEADATSDLDSSSDLEGDSSSEEVTRLPRIGKPSMRPPDRSSLASRLSSFIPAIEQANEELRTGEGTTGNGVSDGLEIEGDGAGEPYIEMELGLGVLEERNEDWNEVDSSSSGASDAEEPGGLAKRDVMGKLMRKKTSKPVIQEVEPL